ncbi:MAG: hypothetical protein E7139_05115 [Rikenellaceae bacterium]|nr:hypothetical protein [Rikenellaceae bacterium]
MDSLLTAATIITPIVLFFVAYVRNKRAEHELRMRLLENNSNPELAKVLIESKLKKEPKLVMLRIGLPAIFASLFGSGFVYILNQTASKDFEGAVLLLIFTVAFGIGLGLVTALIIEHKLLKKAEETK